MSTFMAWVSSRVRRRRWFVAAVAAAGCTAGAMLLGWALHTWTKVEHRGALLTDAKGLRPGAPVMLGGVRIGQVDDVDHVHVEQACSLLTEDLGPKGTDDCDSSAFCSPDWSCAKIEPFVAKAFHAPCLNTHDCDAGEVCVSPDFLMRTRVAWDGPASVCTRWLDRYPRVEVSFSVEPEAAPLISRGAAVTARSDALEIDLVAGPPRPETMMLYEHRPTRAELRRPPATAANR